MRLSELGEFGLIENIKNRFAAARESLTLGIGDDCAVISLGADRFLLFTTDLLVEGIHFLRSASPYLLGRKSLSANLSDIAAMGGDPLYFFLSIGIPKTIDSTYLELFFDGLQSVASFHHVILAGGDTTSSEKSLIINIGVIGECIGYRFLTRGGAKTGDIVQVSGALGLSAAGLQARINNLQEDLYSDLIRAHDNPSARLQVGKALAKSNSVTAMIDLSDGLAQDLGHICRQSHKGAVIQVEKIPTSESIFRAAEALKCDPVNWITGGGEDYELCWTTNPIFENEILEIAEKAGAPSPTSIGVINDGDHVEIMYRHQNYVPSRTGWDHFKEFQEK